MRTPKNIDEAKAIVREEKNKVSSSLSKMIGSRWLLAVLATFAIAFGSHLAYAPSRLPPVGGLSLAAAGLPPGIDFGFAGQQAASARQAAIEQGAPGFFQEKINENRQYVPLLNAIGLGLALLLLGVNMTIMTLRRRETRG